MQTTAILNRMALTVSDLTGNWTSLGMSLPVTAAGRVENSCRIQIIWTIMMYICAVNGLIAINAGNN